MTTLDAFQLVSALLSEIDTDIHIHARCLNILHRRLLEHSIRSSINRYSFEELAMFYPEDIEIDSTEIIIHASHGKKSFNNGYYDMDEQTTKTITELWQAIVKEY